MKIYFFGEDRVPIEFLPHLSSLETHLRPEPYYDLITFKAHLGTRDLLLFGANLFLAEGFLN